MKVFNKRNLILANDLAIDRGYNRAIQPEHLANSADDQLWGVSFHMLHEHKAGQPTEPHVRCMLYPFVEEEKNKYRLDATKGPLFVDVVMGIYEAIPELEAQPNGSAA